MNEVKPWHNTPTCRRSITREILAGLHATTCKGPLIPKRAADWNHRAMPEHRLVCCSCGNGQVGTDEDVERAERAQNAWEAEEARNWAATAGDDVLAYVVSDPDDTGGS